MSNHTATLIFTIFLVRISTFASMSHSGECIGWSRNRTGKTILFKGLGRFGASCADRFASEGANIVIFDSDVVTAHANVSNRISAARVSEELERRHSDVSIKFYPVKLDTVILAERAVEYVVRHFGRVDRVFDGEDGRLKQLSDVLDLLGEIDSDDDGEVEHIEGHKRNGIANNRRNDAIRCVLNTVNGFVVRVVIFVVGLIDPEFVAELTMMMIEGMIEELDGDDALYVIVFIVLLCCFGPILIVPIAIFLYLTVYLTVLCSILFAILYVPFAIVCRCVERCHRKNEMRKRDLAELRIEFGA